MTAAVQDVLGAGAAITAFKSDWQGRERWLSKRLQDPNGCLQALFEIRTAFYLRQIGNSVKYLAPRQEPEPDLRLVYDGESVWAECTLTSPGGGQAIPRPAANQIARALLREMQRSGCQRLVFLRCRRELRPSDGDRLIGELRRMLPAVSTAPTELLDGRYVARVLFGGARVCPITWSRAQQLQQWMQAAPFCMGGIIPLDRRVSAPFGRYLAQGVAVASEVPDRSIEHLVDAALEKRHQLPANAPGIVFAGFGHPLSAQVSTGRRLHAQLAGQVAERWANHPEISGVAFLLAPRASGGQFLETRVVVHHFTNVMSRFKLPPNFTWTM